MMKNGVYFIVIALLVAELFKILVYANDIHRGIVRGYIQLLHHQRLTHPKRLE